MPIWAANGQIALLGRFREKTASIFAVSGPISTRRGVRGVGFQSRSRLHPLGLCQGPALRLRLQGRLEDQNLAVREGKGWGVARKPTEGELAPYIFSGFPICLHFAESPDSILYLENFFRVKFEHGVTQLEHPFLSGITLHYFYDV